MSPDAASGTGTPRLRPAADRGRVATGTAGEGGIEATEAFSRGHAIDRAWMGWGALRVLSRQDWAPGATRDEGRVANMERLLLVLDGVLDVECGGLGRHRTATGEVLWIGAGHGMEVRMANASGTAPLRLLECWLQPDRVNAVPAVAVRAFDEAAGADAWTTLAAGGVPGDIPGHDDHALPLRQRARVMRARIGAGVALAVPAASGARYWLEVLEGGVLALGANAPAEAGGGRAGHALAAGDGLGWLAGDTGAPVTVAAAGPAPAWLLLLVLHP